MNINKNCIFIYLFIFGVDYPFKARYWSYCERFILALFVVFDIVIFNLILVFLWYDLFSF